jgi:hypothetical protein
LSGGQITDAQAVVVKQTQSDEDGDSGEGHLTNGAFSLIGEHQADGAEHQDTETRSNENNTFSPDASSALPGIAEQGLEASWRQRHAFLYGTEALLSLEAADQIEYDQRTQRDEDDKTGEGKKFGNSYRWHFVLPFAGVRPGEAGFVSLSSQKVKQFPRKAV